MRAFVLVTEPVPLARSHGTDAHRSWARPPIGHWTEQGWRVELPQPADRTATLWTSTVPGDPSTGGVPLVWGLLAADRPLRVPGVCVNRSLGPDSWGCCRGWEDASKWPVPCTEPWTWRSTGPSPGRCGVAGRTWLLSRSRNRSRSRSATHVDGAHRVSRSPNLVVVSVLEAHAAPTFGGREVPAMIDEIPLIAVAADPGRRE